MKAYGHLAYAGPEPFGGEAIGGPGSYPKLVTPDACDEVVTTVSRFLSAIQIADRKIWLGAFLNLSSYLELQMAERVLLASDLSGGVYNHNMSAGYVPLIWAGAGCHFLGITVEGPDPAYHSSYAPPYCDGIGVKASARGVIVESCDIHSWQYGGVKTASDTQVLFNYIHDCRHNGIGYGVSVGGSQSNALLKGNYFDKCRHFIEGDAYTPPPTCTNLLTSYEACYNIFGATCDNTQVDMHGGHDPKCGSCNLDWACHDLHPAGKRLYYHHNTALCTSQPPVGVRGVPTESAICEYNVSYYTPSSACNKDVCAEGWRAYRQILCPADQWVPYNYEAPGQRHRMWQQNNWFGSTPPPDIAAKRMDVSVNLRRS